MAVFIGTSSNEKLSGGADNDIISGLGGDDTLFGGGGADSLDGGAGDDLVQGDLGNDVLFGGDGNDLLDGNFGNDLLDGGDGNDIVGGSEGANTLFGGNGDDYVYGTSGENSVVDGGNGNDSIWAGRGDTINGGEGDDVIVARDLNTITGGPGQDHIFLWNVYAPTWWALTKITDFVAGTLGDRLDFMVTLGSLAGSGYDGTTPFANGFLRLRQDGVDTVIDLDGNGGGDDFAPFVHLADVTATALTEYNLGFNPMGNGSPVAPAAPTSLALSVDSDTGVKGDNITSVIRPTVTGTAVSGGTVYLYDGASLIGTSLVANGAWAITPDVQLALGLHSFTSIAADGLGNTSVASPSLNITIEAATPKPHSSPVTPTDLTLAVESDTGVISDNITSIAKPTITGMATTGDTVSLYDGGTLVGTSAVVGGTWAITPIAPLAMGPHIFTATAADSIGNTSVGSAPFQVTIDSTHSFTVWRAGAATQVAASEYSGPVAHLNYELIGLAGDEVVIGTGSNDFINTLGGTDAVDAGAGDDVIDGGTGSNFLTGGAGIDVFFLDGRGGTVTWSTITDWQAGEQLSIWGYRPGVSTLIWDREAGAYGFKGLTMHADLDGNGTVDTSVTWTGLSSRDQLPRQYEFGTEGLLWFT